MYSGDALRAGAPAESAACDRRVVAAGDSSVRVRTADCLQRRSCARLRDIPAEATNGSAPRFQTHARSSPVTRENKRIARRACTLAKHHKAVGRKFAQESTNHGRAQGASNG